MNPTIRSTILMALCALVGGSFQVEAAARDCSMVRCGWGAQCAMVKGSPVCRCNEVCPAIYEPVCGADWVTYGNQCELETAACQQKKEIRVANKGLCETFAPTSPRTPVRGCGQACPALYQPVCGTDGKTYSNECQLKMAECESGGRVRKAQSGKCPSKPPIDCDSISCIQIYKPVCGSNGRTYGNDCELGVATCRDASVTKRSDGPCPGSGGGGVKGTTKPGIVKRCTNWGK